MWSLYYCMVLPCMVVMMAINAAANSQNLAPKKAGAPVSANLQLDAAALDALSSGKSVVAEVSFDVKRLSPSEPAKGDVRVMLGRPDDSSKEDDRLVGLINLGTENDDKPVRRQRSLVELNRGLTAMNLTQAARDGSIPVTLSIDAPEQSNVEIGNAKIKLRR